jgi:hypothetical protein
LTLYEQSSYALSAVTKLVCGPTRTEKRKDAPLVRLFL